jgi:hypothetical protein
MAMTADCMLPQPAEPFEWIDTPHGPAIVCRALEVIATHLFTTRAWRLGSPDREAARGWADVAAAMTVDERHLCRVHQVHGTSTVVARAGVADELPEGDIILSDQPDTALAIKTADCVPILIADRATGAVAAVHAGWRGLAARAPEVAVAELAARFGSVPADLVVAIGPAISACCYEVGEDVRARFADGFDEDDVNRWFSDVPLPSAANRSMPTLPPARRPRHWFFAAPDVARDQIVRGAGVPAGQVYASALCTASHPEFCSYRRDGAAGAGRLVAAIRPSPRRP